MIDVTYTLKDSCVLLNFKNQKTFIFWLGALQLITLVNYLVENK